MFLGEVHADCVAYCVFNFAHSAFLLKQEVTAANKGDGNYKHANYYSGKKSGKAFKHILPPLGLTADITHKFAEVYRFHQEGIDNVVVHYELGYDGAVEILVDRSHKVEYSEYLYDG